MKSSPLDAIARYLAGLPPRVDEVYSHGVDWQEHAKELNLLFDQFDERHARPFSRWAEAHMGRLRDVEAVFYPFSGPDFTFAHLLYPQADTYVLCGLESCEILPPWEALTSKEVSKALSGVVSGMSHFLRYSYFITKEMRHDLHASRLQGVLPALLVFLTRCGHRVESVVAVDLDPLGNPIDAQGKSSHGICIHFQAAGKDRRLFYFLQDLRDEYCPADHPLLLFIARLQSPAVFAKSASYLLHEANFSHLRELIFSECSVLVQDPSHLPYRSFAQRGWQVDLHGQYVGTLQVFHTYEQPDLVQACETSATALDFGIGYLTKPEMASLMIATPTSR